MPEIKPAATVLVVRPDPEDGIKVLLLKRNSKLTFAPNFWVFPGGRIEPADGPFGPDKMEHTAKTAAVREAYEESQLTLNPHHLTHFCHWTTPLGGKKRFGTWFFHTLMEDNYLDVSIDQSEIVDYKWVHPNTALHLLWEHKIDLLPPTLISLNRIKNATSYADVTLEFARTGVVKAAPVTRLHEGKFYCLYQGDTGYQHGDIADGPQQHRLIIDSMKRSYDFRYQNCPHIPPVTGGIPL